MAWFKLLGNYKTEEEALKRAQEYIKEPYVQDFYIEKARKYYHVVIDVDVYGLKHADDLGEDNPFN